MRYVKSSIFFFATSLLLIFSYQNCSDVAFQTTDELLSQGIMGQLRSVEFDPELEPKPEIEVNAIVDDSDSMKEIQDKVRDALVSTTSILKEFDGSVKVYTTSQNLSDSGNKKPNTSTEKLAEVLEGGNPGLYPLADLNLPNAAPYKYKEITDYILQPKFGSLPFNKDMSGSQFQNFTNAFANQIDAVGVQGSGQEQGLCALLRLAKNRKSDGKFHAYIVATNEDDATDWRDCLKQKERVRENKAVASTSNCSPGSPGCISNYQVKYKPLQKEEVRYSYMQLNEYLDYRSLESEISYKGTLEYYTTELKIKYKRHRNQIKTTYVPTVFPDQVPRAGDPKSTYNTSLGLCTFSSRECTQSEKDNLNVFPGSTCTVTCNDSKSGSYSSSGWYYQSLSKYKSKYGRKNVSDFGVSASLCASDLEEVKGSMSLATCEYYTKQNRSRRTLSMSSSPNTCSGYHNVACSSAEKNNLIAMAGGGYASAPSAEVTCTRNCSETVDQPKTYSISSARSTCPGMGLSQEGEVAVASCSPSEEDIARQRLGVGPGAAIECTRMCKQDVKSATRTMADNTFCSPVSQQACNANQETFARGQFSGSLVDCSYSCNNKSPATCNFSSSNANMCSTNLVANGSCPNRSTSLDMPTCRISSSSASAQNFQLQSGSTKNIFFTENNEDLIQATAGELRSAHNELFYLAAFIMPSDSNNSCPRIDPSWTNGVRYEALSEILGKNSDTYPVCLDNYAPSFDAIFNLVADKARRSYVINLNSEAGEWVYRVKVYLSDGQILTLNEQDYSLSGNTLSIADNIPVLNATKVKVDIVVPLTEEEIQRL